MTQSSKNSENERYPSESKESWIKCRYIALLLGFILEFFLYANKISLGVTIVSMVNNSAPTNEENPKSESCMNLLSNLSHGENSDYAKTNGEFNWTPKLQGYILGGNFLFYVVGTFPAAKLVEKFGCKKVSTWCMFVTSVCTFISPFAAWQSVYLMIIAQCIRGLVEPAFVLSESVLVANWCPKSERGFSYTTIITGSCWGGVLGSFISGLLCDVPVLGGWPLPFFTFGCLGFIATISMVVFMYDNPSVHPRISTSEYQYITENQENVLTQKRPKTPWRNLFTSVPVYALACAYFGQMWAISNFLAVYPTFLGTILHYPIDKNGLFSALPFLLQFLTTLSSGCFSNFVTNKKYMSIDTARKFWNDVASFGYAACLLGIYFARCNRSVSIIFGICSGAFIGFANAGCWITSPDMSPTFAASINAISCTIGFTAHFLLPVLVGFLTNNMQTIEQWDKIHFISMSVVALSGLIFHFFGSANTQSWNDVQKDEKDDIKEETRF